MGIITHLRIYNYGILKDVAMGNSLDNSELGNMVAVIGSSGSGKSTIADAFGFIADCISTDVETALNIKNRGGFDKLITQGSSGMISIALSYQSDDTRSLSYVLSVGKDAQNRPCALAETLSLGLLPPSYDKKVLLRLDEGKGGVYEGKIIPNGKFPLEQLKTVELSDSRKLGIVTLGALKQYPIISEFLDFMKSWYLCYFTPDAARKIQSAVFSQYLNSTGDNINNVAQYMYQENPEGFRKVLSDIQAKIPDIAKIEPMQMPNGQMELAFYQQGFHEPFFSSRMSDGTLKLFAYYLMLHEKNPRQLIFIEEPENGLYHHYLADLALEMKKSAGNGYTKQIFVTTHSPFFVNALSPEQVWVLAKDANGFATATQASNFEFVKELTEEGVALGDLWYSKYFG